MGAKYPDIKLYLFDGSPNTNYLVSRVCKLLRKQGVSEDEIRAFASEAYEGDNDNLLRVVLKWVAVE